MKVKMIQLFDVTLWEDVLDKTLCDPLNLFYFKQKGIRWSKISPGSLAMA